MSAASVRRLTDDELISQTIHHFRRTYLQGIPPIIANDASAYLSFICVLSGIEVLAGFRYASTQTKSGRRFEMFVAHYFPDDLKPHAQKLWRFRCRTVHAFSPAGFAVIHKHREVHLHIHSGTGNPVLNAEDFLEALATAAERYFDELRSDRTLQSQMIERLNDRRDGGTFGVGPLQVEDESEIGPSSTTQP